MNPACSYCRHQTMPLVDGLHVSARGRKFVCGRTRARRGSGYVRPEECSNLAAPNTDAVLTDAVRRECLPPWLRHPQPWTDVVVRRATP